MPIINGIDKVLTTTYEGEIAMKMNEAKDAKTVADSRGYIEKAIANVDAMTRHATDHYELWRMLRTTEERLRKLKLRMSVTRRGRGRKKRSILRDSYAKEIVEYELLAASLKKAIIAHEEVFLVAKGTKPRKLMGRVLSSFADCISNPCGRWYILEEWYKDARNILANIKQRAENLQHFKFAGA